PDSRAYAPRSRWWCSPRRRRHPRPHCSRRSPSGSAQPRPGPPWVVLLLGGRLAESDDHPAFRLLANARARDLGVSLECQVDRTALERLHRIEGDRVARHLDLARGTQGDLSNRVLAALPVTLDVDDDPLTFPKVTADHDIGHRLQSAKRFPTPADQGTQASSPDVEGR